MKYFVYVLYLLFVIFFGFNAVLFNNIPKNKRLFIPLMFFSGVVVSSLISNHINIEDEYLKGFIIGIILLIGAGLSTFFSFKWSK